GQGLWGGGGLAGEIRSGHDSELAMGLLPYCRASNWPVRVIEEPLLRWETRPLGQRRSAAAENLLLDMEYLVAHHHERLSRSPEALSNCHAQAGGARARAG